MRSGLTEGALVRISVGLLITIGGGLVTGTAYFVSISAANDVNRQEIIELKAKMKTQERLAEDIAVIRTKIENIERILNKR